MLHTLLEMYKNPIEDLFRLPDTYRQFKKIFDHLKEYQPDSLSDLLMDKELDKIYTKIYLCDLVANYKKPETPLKGDLGPLKNAFEKDRKEYKDIIPLRQHWLGTPEGYLYDAYVENLIENNGYNTFIVKNEFELNLIVSYFNTSYKAVKKYVNLNVPYPFIIDFNNRYPLHPMVYVEFPIGTELPNVRPISSQ